ncbi:hypothetical protein HA466_0280260 [Hirschfeldia incana]|nr:hypothetical protein HA466_0280260 [Hirschfeldia incana]
MLNTKKLLKMAKKWQQRAALQRKRISFQRSTTSSPAAEKGCFVVYTVDKARFSLPISLLSNSVFQELLKILRKSSASKLVDQSHYHLILFSWSISSN